ncbi:MAG: ribosome-associated translation inhibitor RaiA [Syntrophobacterales bacterium]|jgi:putative sigma-54 modulation protein|nr:ribosome-associated translation inhibitor RaiA [Syntrophobacterales bacterium]
MDITISFRHISPEDEIKKYVKEKIAKLQKYVEMPLDVHAVLSLERKYRHRIDVMFIINGVVINAHEVTDDMHAAVDNIVDKLERRLTRFRDKLKKYRELRPKSGASTQTEAVSKIIAAKTVDAKPMDPEEATMQLEASGDSFMIFSDRERGNICVIYKRKDGNFSLIETQGKIL